MVTECLACEATGLGDRGWLSVHTEPSRKEERPGLLESKPDAEDLQYSYLSHAKSKRCIFKSNGFEERSLEAELEKRGWGRATRKCGLGIT